MMKIGGNGRRSGPIRRDRLSTALRSALSGRSARLSTARTGLRLLRVIAIRGSALAPQQAANYTRVPTNCGHRQTEPWPRPAYVETRINLSAKLTKESLNVGNAGS